MKLKMTSFPSGSAGKESACNVGDLSLIPGLGRSPGEGKGYPVQYSSLENSKDCIVHGVAKSGTRLGDFHFHFLMTASQTSGEAMAPHSSTLAWKILWMEEPGRLRYMGSLRVRWLSVFTFIFHFHALDKAHSIGEDPLQCSCLENPRDRGAWWAAVYGVTQSLTQLKWLSSSSAVKHLSIYYVHSCAIEVGIHNFDFWNKLYET